MGDHWRDVTTTGRPSEHARKGIGHKIKKNRGGRIPLAEAPAIGEEVANEPINRDGSMTTREQLHDTMNISSVETLGQQDLFEESSANGVIGFLEV